MGGLGINVFFVMRISGGGGVMLIAHFILHRAGTHPEPHAERVVGGQSCGEQQHPSQQLETWPVRYKGFSENRILGEETAGQRKASKAQTTDQHRVTHDFPSVHVTKAGEFAKIELARKAVHDRAASEEEDGL